jgi:Transglutaminase-like superfamily
MLRVPVIVTTMRTVVTPAGSERLNAVQRIRVAVEVVSTYCSARWWLLRLSFPDAVAAARDVMPDSRPILTDDESRAVGVRLGNAVQRTLRVLPVDSRCLVTALVLTRMLARRGIDSSFVLGVRAKPRFAAHAWVERGGVALLPTATEFHRLKVI